MFIAKNSAVLTLINELHTDLSSRGFPPNRCKELLTTAKPQKVSLNELRFKKNAAVLQHATLLSQENLS